VNRPLGRRADRYVLHGISISRGQRQTDQFEVSG
jgi:hypothetical protein